MQRDATSEDSAWRGSADRVSTVGSVRVPRCSATRRGWARARGTGVACAPNTIRPGSADTWDPLSFVL